MARVTVLMPVYNGERFLREAVESVFAQTFTDFELLVVDDGSADETPRILEAIADPRLRVVRNETNRGVGFSLNRGLALATGEYVAQHDADDVSDRMRLACQVAHLDAHPDLALVASWYRKIDEAGRALGDRELPTTPAHIAWTLLLFCPFVHSTVIYRRPAVLDVGGYDASLVYAHDYELWSRLCARYRAACLPLHLLAYRVSRASLTATIGAVSDEGGHVALRNAARLLEAAGRPAPTLEQHRAMFELYSGTRVPDSPAAIETAFHNLVGLIDVFCAHGGVGAAEALEVRASVRATLRHRLVDAMDRLDDQTFARLRRLVGGGSALGSALSRWFRRG